MFIPLFREDEYYDVGIVQAGNKHSIILFAVVGVTSCAVFLFVLALRKDALCSLHTSFVSILLALLWRSAACRSSEPRGAQGRSAQTPDTPFFADDLTRPKLGDIPHLNDKVAADVRMTPDPNSHMVIMGGKTDVWCPPDKFIEVAPNLNIVGFTPVTFTIYDSEQPPRPYSVDNKELLRIDPPTRSNRKVVYVKAFDAQGHDRLLMQCIVRNHIANPTITALDYKEHDEKCGFAIKDRQSFTNTCLYLGDMYLGRVGEGEGQSGYG